MTEWLDEVRRVLTTEVGARQANALIRAEACLLASMFTRGQGAELAARMLLAD